MGFATGSISCRRFRLPKSADPAHFTATPAHQPPAELTPPDAHGLWLCDPRNCTLPADMHLEAGRLAWFGVRIDSRKVDTARFRARVAEAVKDWRKARKDYPTDKRIPRGARVQIEDETRQAMLYETSAKTKVHEVLIDFPRGVVYVNAGGKALDLILAFLGNMFGGDLGSFVAGHSPAAVEDFFKRAVSDRIESIYASGAVVFDGIGKNTDQARITVTTRYAVDDVAEARTALESDRPVIKAKLGFRGIDDDDRVATVDSVLALSGLKVPAQEGDKDDPRAAVLHRAEVLAGVFAIIDAALGAEKEDA